MRRKEMEGGYAFDAGVFAIQTLEWNPDANQREILESSSRRVILNWGRQSGKTTLAAVKMLHEATCFPESLCVWLSANKEHTAELFWKLDGFLMKMGVPAQGQTGKQLSRVLPNGSRIAGLAARDATVRGYTARMLVIDEGAQVRDEVYDAAAAVLAIHNGTLWVLGTPRGKSGRFWDIWSKGGMEWLKSMRKTADCGRVGREFLEAEARLKSRETMRREYECEFVNDGSRFLDGGDVDRLFERR